MLVNWRVGDQSFPTSIWIHLWAAVMNHMHGVGKHYLYDCCSFAVVWGHFPMEYSREGRFIQPQTLIKQDRGNDGGGASESCLPVVMASDLISCGHLIVFEFDNAEVWFL